MLKDDNIVMSHDYGHGHLVNYAADVATKQARLMCLLDRNACGGNNGSAASSQEAGSDGANVQVPLYTPGAPIVGPRAGTHGTLNCMPVCVCDVATEGRASSNLDRVRNRLAHVRQWSHEYRATYGV
jgi:hypothetical protein